MKTRTWIIIFAAVCAFCIAFFFLFPKSGANIVGIYQDGELVKTIDLAAVDEPYTLTFERGGSTNTVSVARGTICVSDADCPDGICVSHGELKTAASPIVCLPNRLVIKFIGRTANGGVDVIAGAAK